MMYEEWQQMKYQGAAVPALPPPNIPDVSLTQDEYELLVSILRIQSKSGETEGMRGFTRSLGKMFGADAQRHEGNLYLTKGVAPDGIYPCYVAHLDTVHRICEPGRFQVGFYPKEGEDDYAQDLFGFDPETQEARGVGGDDKVGIFVALQMLRESPYCKVAFFRDEETGGQGVSLAHMTFFDDVGFVIECDRRGNDDIIRNASGVELYGSEWAAAIKDVCDIWKYSNAHGAFTDVVTLKRKGLKVACCNMSCGYYAPHTDKEYVRPKDVARCLNFVRGLTEVSIGKRWEHEWTPPPPPKPVPVIRQGHWKNPQAMNKWEKLMEENRAAADDPTQSYAAVKRWLKEDDDWEWGDDYDWDAFDRRSQEDAVNGWCPECYRTLTFSGYCATCYRYIDEKETLWNNPEGTGATLAVQCTTCGDYCTQYDDTVGFYYCFSCDDYFVLDDEDSLDKSVDDGTIVLPIGDEVTEGEPEHAMASIPA